MSSAVGPSITLPKTVGAISTPFVVGVGTASRMWRTSGRASLSKTMSSPRRGVTVKPPKPAIRWTSSLRRPAALTMKRARSGCGSPPPPTPPPPPRRGGGGARPAPGPPPPRHDDVPAAVAAGEGGHARVAAQLAAREHRLCRERDRRRERADDALAGHLERAARAGAEVRLAPVQLVGADLAQVVG